MRAREALPGRPIRVEPHLAAVRESHGANPGIKVFSMG